MPIRRRALLSAALAPLLATLAAVPAHAARTAVVGPGHAPGIAVDAAGTAYAAWKYEVPGEPTDNGTRFCVLARDARGCSAPPVDLAFPGAGYYVGTVSVLLPAPGVVDVVVGRVEGPLDYAVFLSRSTDGGRTFAPGYRLNGAGTQAAGAAELTADGRVALGGGDIRGLRAGLARADGSDEETQMMSFDGDVNSGFYSDVAAAGNDVVALGGNNNASQGFRLPAGAAPDDETAWRALPVQRGGRGKVAGGPVGIVSLLDSAPAGQGQLYAQRLEGDAWGPVVPVFRDKVSGTELAQNEAGRQLALWTADNRLSFAGSDDGGALWSYGEPLMTVPDGSNDISADVAPDGRGAAAVGEQSGDDEPIRIAWLDLRRTPQATVQVGDALVQVRSSCLGGRRIGMDARASRAGRKIPVSSVLRSARFSARRAVRTRARGYSATFRLRSARAKPAARVRLTPRTGPAV
ncbi:MAG: hypothetical protein AVDCRST_MAG30-1618, partial [uncultured Solirubrobacteraceae bacterium]